MKKYVYILMMLLLLSGCSTKYNLEISNKGIKEEIETKILDAEIPKRTKEEVNANIELDDPITPFIENDQYPFVDNKEKKYIKEVKKNNGSTNVTLKYNYSFDDYKNSRVYKECFAQKSFDYDKKSYLLQFSGKFYCMYGNEIEVNIKTNNKVNSHNADKVSGNTYTWIINNDNKDKTNIKMNISNESAYTMPAVMIVLVIVFIILIIGGYTVFQKINNRDEINKI